MPRLSNKKLRVKKAKVDAKAAAKKHVARKRAQKPAQGRERA